MIEDMESFRLPRYAQIPNVGLYLEQVVRYVNAHLAPLGEPELTNSMVSNYVKQSLIPAPIKRHTHRSTLRGFCLSPWSNPLSRWRAFG